MTSSGNGGDCSPLDTRVTAQRRARASEIPRADGMETRVIDLTPEAPPARRASAIAVFTLSLGAA